MKIFFGFRWSRENWAEDRKWRHTSYPKGLVQIPRWNREERIIVSYRQASKDNQPRDVSWLFECPRNPVMNPGPSLHLLHRKLLPPWSSKFFDRSKETSNGGREESLIRWNERRSKFRSNRNVGWNERFNRTIRSKREEKSARGGEREGKMIDGVNVTETRICRFQEDLEMLEDPRIPPLKRISYGIVLPTICCFGIVGNILNLIVLTRRNMRGTAYIYMRGK